jgi:hypothetical protein
VAVLHDTPGGGAAADAAGDGDGLAERGLSHRRLAAWLERLPARRKLVIYATCHGGVGKSKLAPSVERLVRSAKGEAAFAALEDVSEGTLVLAAAAGSEAAREDDRLRGDVYTHYLLEGADAFDRNRDGMVTALEAHDYAKERTYAWSKGRQRPTAEAQMIGDADVPLVGTRKRSGLPVLEAYDQEWSGFSIAVDGGVKGKLPLAFPLKAGGEGSRVSLFGPGDEGKKGRKPLAEFEVQGERGERIDLADVLAPPPWLVSFEVVRESWDDAAFERLAGTSSWGATRLSGSFRQELGGETWTLGVAATPEREVGDDLRPSLEARLAVTSWQGTLGWERALPGAPAWLGAVLLGVGEERARLTLRDGVTSEELTYDVRSSAFRLAATVERQISGGVSLGLGAERTLADYDFGGPGRIGATRTGLSLNLNWRFGGVARRL